MNGKSKCKILKDIRRQIAQDNDIAYVTSECKYQGDCSGTCPKCEAELQYLENELRKRQNAGKAIAVAGIAATLMLGTAACVDQPLGGDLKGDVAYNESSSTTTVGDIPNVTDPTEELMGDPVEDVTEPTEDLPTGVPPVDEPEGGLPDPGTDEGDWGTIF